MAKIPPIARPTGARAEIERRETRRVGRAQKLAQASVADREQMLDQMFRVMLEFAEHSGISRERTAHVFAQARRGVVKAPYRLSDALHFKVMARIGDVLNAWYTEPEYLDARGVPAPLPLSGARSVESLIARFLPKVNDRDTARWLIAEGVLRERRGHLVPARRTISFTEPNTMMLDRIPFLLQGLLSTFNYNIAAKAKGEDTRCERFPISQVPRFSWEVKRLVPMLLDQLETWAAPYLDQKESSSPKTARVGVEVFSFVEKHASRRRRQKA